MSIPPPPPGAQPPQPMYAPQYGAAAPAAMRRRSAPIGWAAFATAVLCAVSPLLPWVTFGDESFNGYEEVIRAERFAGIAVSFFAGVAAVLLILGTTLRNRVLFIIGTVFAGLAALMPLGDLGTISDRNDLGADFTPAAGLIAAIALGAVSMTCGIIAAVQSKKVAA